MLILLGIATSLLLSLTTPVGAQELPQWTVEPAQRIGVALGDPDYEFADIMGAVRLGDGSVVVGEMQNQEIRFFGPEGRLVRRQGRDGEGPGEYHQVRFVLTCGGDSVWVYDTNLARLTVLTSNGEVAGIYAGPRVEAASGPYLLRCDDRGRLVALGWARGEREAFIAGKSGAFRGTQLAVLLDRTGTVRDTIGVFPSGERYLFRRRDGSPSGSGPRRFGAETHVAIGRGRAFVGDAALPEVYVYQGDGLDTLALPVKATALTQADLDRSLEERLAETTEPNARARARAAHAEYDYPDRYPYYSDLRVDATGLLWVREYPRPGRRDVEWLVVHPEAGAVARVVLPARLQVTQIGRNFILGIDQAEGVEVIQQYRLTRAK